MRTFKAAHAGGPKDTPAADLVARVVDALQPVPAAASLGVVYVTDPLAASLGAIHDSLARATGIAAWAGCIGVGVCGHDGRSDSDPAEYHGDAAIAVLLADPAPDSFRTFSAIRQTLEGFERDLGPWLRASHAGFGILHGDPRNGDIADLLDALAEATGCFVVGGLTAAPSLGGADPAPDQIASTIASTRPGQAGEGETDAGLTGGGLSGVLLGGTLEVASGMTQGCTPIGHVRTITQSADNVIAGLNGRPALECLIEDIGPDLSRDLSRIGGQIFAGKKVESSGDYLVRNLVGLDLQRGLVAIGDLVEDGEGILFCRRDRASARHDLQRMLEDLKRRAGKPPRAGFYHSCVARGPHLFDADRTEMMLIREVLGDFPLIGFFGNGEISQNRVYGYTGVLTLFL